MHKPFIYLHNYWSNYCCKSFAIYPCVLMLDSDWLVTQSKQKINNLKSNHSKLIQPQNLRVQISFL